MNKKILFLFFPVIAIFFVFNIRVQAQTPAGDYQVGDTKCTIKLDETSAWRVFWDGVEGSSGLKYKENMVTGDQVWVERRKGKVVGNFILNNDYTSGRYVRFSDDAKLDVVKIQ